MIIVLFLLLVSLHSNNSPTIARSQKKNSAITYTITGGRLGDHLLAYAKAKYIALQHKIPLLYKPFELSDQLKIDILELHYSNEMEKNYSTIKPICSEPTSIEDNTLYVLTSDHWRGFRGNDAWYGLPYNRPFFNTLQKYITPSVEVPPLEKEDHGITIAIHIRTGGDYAYDRTVAPKDKGKFPSKQYYIKQLALISSLFPKKELYVYLFTDDRAPKQLLEGIKKIFTNPRYHWWCRTEYNSHDCNVIEDLYMMAQCNCLIRPRSCYSAIAQVIGNHEIVSYITYSEQPYFLVKTGRLIRHMQEKDIKKMYKIKSSEPGNRD